MKIFVKAILLTVAALVLIKSCSPFLGTESPLKGKAAPDFSLSSVHGKQVQMSSLRGDRPAILYFWATWCPHCREHLDALVKINDSIWQSGIALIIIDIEESREKVSRYLTDKNIPLDSLLDKDGTVARDYMIWGVPTYFLINREGVVIEAGNALPEGYAALLLSSP